MKPSDQSYAGIPWKKNGRTREGIDCVGLVMLFLREEMGIETELPGTDEEKQWGVCEKFLQHRTFDPLNLRRGDVVFFRRKGGKISHIAVHLGALKFLHIIGGLDSRIETGLVLLARVGMNPVASIHAEETKVLQQALRDANLGWTAVILLVISIALSLVSTFLLSKQARFGNKYGRYGFDALVTQNSPEIPLPDLLGEVVVAGNSPYTQLSDKHLTGTASNTKCNKVVILSSGPTEEIDYLNFGISINGLSYNDKYFSESDSVNGFFINPAQTKAEAVTGTIRGETKIPTITTYDGAHAISVPVDIRASYDRTFPLYGFSGCSYLIFRLIDSSKFQNFNVTIRVKGRQCRTFDEDGFVTDSETAESLSGADGTKVRFKLANADIIAVSAVTVNGTSYSEISAGTQTGNVFYVNKTKGYIEFITAPAAAATVLCTYTFYPREWTQNPASHLVYLLTEKLRGKGFDESRIDWQAAVDLRDYSDESLDWNNSNGVTTAPRYQANYAIDFRKPIQEHIRSVLDSCYAYLFVSNGKFVMRSRAAGTSVFSFNESNIIKDSFSSELMDRADKPNQIRLFYHSRTTYNAENEVRRDDVTDQRSRAERVGNNGVVEENLKHPAVDNQEQAERIAETILREQVNSRWLCGFTTNIQGLALEPGDLVDITHSSQPSWVAKLFRIEDLGYDEQDRLQLKLSEYFEGAYI